MSEVTKPKHVLSWRVEAEKVRGRGEMDGVKMGEGKQIRKPSAGHRKDWGATESY